ncbi:hypothetical protein BS47DRAFT_1293386, partial [Hydnum rufescens UP504]
GSEWVCLVKLWIAIERELGFPTEGKALSSKDRPKAIHDWIQRARSIKYSPSIKPDSFGKQWWKWWSNLQPAWRETSKGEIIARNQDISGNWESLKIGGKNGIVAVVITLGWWGAVLDTIARDKSEWNAHLGMRFLLSVDA